MKTALGIALVACAFLTACGTTPPAPPAEPAAPEPAVKPAPAPEVLRPFPADSFYDLLVAEVALRRGEYELALGNYLEQAKATRDAGVAARAARLAQFLRADRAALEATQLWVQLEPEELEAHFTLATLLAKEQRPLDAMPHMVKVLDAGAKANFAAIAASALQLPEADQQALLDEFNRLLATHPDNLELMTGKALLLQQRDQKDEALALIRTVLKQAPEDTHAIIIEAKLLQEMGRKEEAFTRLGQVVDQYPYNRRLRLQYARLLTSTDMNKAREQFEILVQQSPNDPDLLLSLALVNKEVGELDDAERYFNQLLEMEQHTQEAHYYLGQLAEQRGDRAGAIAHYKEIPPSEDFFPAIARMIQLMLEDNRLPELRKHLRDMREQYPQHAVRLYLVESEVLMQQQRYAAGTQLLTEALKQFPQQPNLLYARSMFSEKRRDVKLLEQDLRAILAKDPNNVIALNALGYTLANLTDRLPEARDLIGRALEQKPDDPAILDSMGWVEYRLGNLRRARELLEKAYAAFPDQEVAAHLGEVLWQLGERERAREIWTEALEAAPESELLKEALERYPADPDKP